jgi:hypothetical protein
MSQALRDGEGNYVINGKKYASVTTILGEMLPKPELDAWKERNENWPTLTRHARIYGTIMHMRLQDMVSDIPPDVPSEMPYQQWPKDIEEELDKRIYQWEKLGLVMGKPNMVEHTVVIHEAKSAGTLDWFGPIDGMKTVLDWKSSKRPYKSHRMQLGAYFLGLLAEGKIAEWGMIPYVRRDRVILVEMTPDEMYEEGQKFLEIAAKFYMDRTR